MYFDFSQKSSLLLVFFAHGTLVSVLALMAAFRSRDRALFWLSFFLFLSCLYIAPFMFGYAGWYGRDGYRELLFYVPFQQLLLLPPVLYFYIRQLLDPSYRLRGMALWHFVPALLYLAYSGWIFVHDLTVAPVDHYYLDGKDRDFSVWYQVVGFCSMIVYTLASLRQYNLYRSRAMQSLSYADAVQYAWIRQVLMALTVLLFLRSLFFLLNPEWDEFGRKFWYYLCFSIVFCYIGFRGYLHAIEVRTMTDHLRDRSVAPGLTRSELPDAVVAKVREEELANGRLEALADWSVWKQKLDQLMMEGQVFKDPLLTLPGLAEQLGLAPRNLSMLINEAYHMNFNDFVNRHRTDAVVRMFEAGEHSLQTLLGIAYDCGFNSKSTFNRTFKKHKGLSPREFLAKWPENQVSNQDLGRSE